VISASDCILGKCSSVKNGATTGTEVCFMNPFMQKRRNGSPSANTSKLASICHLLDLATILAQVGMKIPMNYIYTSMTLLVMLFIHRTNCELTGNMGDVFTA